MHSDRLSPANVDSNVSDDEPITPEMARLIRVQWSIGVLELLVFLVGTPANIAVLCLGLFQSRNVELQAGRKRNITRYLVVSMTLADLLFCVIHSPMMYMSYNLSVDFSAIPCLTLFAVTHLSTVASSLSLLLINLDKFLHLRQPLHYAMYVTTYRGVCAVLICWVISIGWSLLFIFGSFMEYDMHCDVRLTDKTIYILFAFIFFVIPTIISLVISIYVALVVFKARLRMRKGRKFGQTGPLALQINLHFCNNSSVTGSVVHKLSTLTSISAQKKSSANGSAMSSNKSSPNFTTPARKISSITNGEVKRTGLNGNMDCSNHLCPWSTYANGTHQLLVPPSQSRLRRRASSSIDLPTCTSNDQSLHTSIHHSHGRRKRRFRRLGFVFTTTLWTTLTVLPYRLCFIIWNIFSPNREAKSYQVAETIYFFLFAIMTLNAAGNPFITIITQRQYSVKLAKLWEKFQKRDSIKKMVSAGDILHFANPNAGLVRKRRSSL